MNPVAFYSWLGRQPIEESMERRSARDRYQQQQIRLGLEDRPVFRKTNPLNDSAFEDGVAMELMELPSPNSKVAKLQIIRDLDQGPTPTQL